MTSQQKYTKCNINGSNKSKTEYSSRMMPGKRAAPSSPAVDGQDDARMMGLGVHSRHMPMMFEHSAIKK